MKQSKIEGELNPAGKRRMRAVVLAAGHGKRMRSATAKVMHLVLGKPMIWRILKTLDELGRSFESMPSEVGAQQITLEEIYVIVGHNGVQVEDGIKKYVEECQPVARISTCIQEPQLGTGHALMSLQPELHGYDGDLLILPGDCPLLSKQMLADLVGAYVNQKGHLGMLTTTLEDPTGYGRILRSASRQVLAIVEEKDASEKVKLIPEVNASIYCFDWTIAKKGLREIKNNNKQGEYYLTDLVGWAAKDDYKIVATEAHDWRKVMGVNSRVDLAQANKLLNEMVIDNLCIDKGVSVFDPGSTWIAPEVTIGQDTVILPGCWLVGNINIGQFCTIGPHTSVEGKVKIGSQTKIIQSRLEGCQIGDNCQIGPFAHLRPGTDIKNNVRIGNFVEIKMSSIDSQTNVSHLSYVGDTTVGREANIGAGAITANYDHITKAKSATVIEDGAAIGSNAVLVAPVKVGKESVVAAGTVITKDVEAGALAVGRAKQENMPGWTKKRKEKNQQK